MAAAVSAPWCPACGAVIPVAACPVCGAVVDLDVSGGHGAHAIDVLDRGASERDQTASDRDQTTSDDDQTAADRDQASSDQDQRSSNEDQVAADADRSAGSDASTYDRTTRSRTGTTDDRSATSRERDDIARARLHVAAVRDRSAAARDRGAKERDAVARRLDGEDDPDAPRDDLMERARRDRERAAVDRERAADDRAQAAADRQVAAHDRAEALRVQSESDGLLRAAGTDELTGARMRPLGLDEISRELERARRTGAQLLLAFVDVDRLKLLNDSQGHLAGDALLRLVGETLRVNLRPYDVIVRYGGDEFLCAMPNISAAEARARFLKIAHTLAGVNAGHSITFGLAQADARDTLEIVISRADAELLRARSARAAGGRRPDAPGQVS